MPAGSRCALNPDPNPNPNPSPHQVSQSQPMLSPAERGEWALVLSEFRSFVQAARAPPAPHPRPARAPPAPCPRPARAHATALVHRL